MRRFKMFGSGALLLVALLLVAIPASASAKSAELQFTEEGNPVASGTSAKLLIEIGECNAEAKGEIGEDPAKTVVVKATATSSGRCSHGLSESGNVEEESWSSKGKLKVKAAIEITNPVGPCVYNFTKFKLASPVEIPGEPYVEGTTSGKLNKVASSKVKGACEKKMEANFTVGALTAGFEEFGMSLT